MGRGKIGSEHSSCKTKKGSRSYIKQKPLFLRTLFLSLKSDCATWSFWLGIEFESFVHWTFSSCPTWFANGRCCIWLVSGGIWRGLWDTSSGLSYTDLEHRTSIHSKSHHFYYRNQMPTAYILQLLNTLQEIEMIWVYTLEKYHSFFLTWELLNI